MGTTNRLVAVLEGGEPIVRSQPPDQAKIEAQIKILKDTRPGEDARRIRNQIAELQLAVMILGRVMYTSAVPTRPGEPGQPGDNGHTETHGEDVIEGEYSAM